MGDKMNDIDEVKNRIRKRKYQPKGKMLDDYKFKTLYNTMIRFMVVLTVGLFIATCNKTETLSKVMDNVLNTQSYEIAKVWISTNLFGFDESSEVGQSMQYVSLGENEYTNYTNEVKSIKSGRVIYTGYQEMMGYYATVLLDNDVEVTYSAMDNIQVELYDIVETDQTIGTYQESIVLLFEYLGEEISYETYQGME